ncbi:25707_t:CDS:1, partial [Gigaspora margarita]
SLVAQFHAGVFDSISFVALESLVVILLFLVVLDLWLWFRCLYGTGVFGFRRNFYIGACLEDDFVVASA